MQLQRVALNKQVGNGDVGQAPREEPGPGRTRGRSDVVGHGVLGNFLIYGYAIWHRWSGNVRGIMVLVLLVLSVASHMSRWRRAARQDTGAESVAIASTADAGGDLR